MRRKVFWLILKQINGSFYIRYANDRETNVNNKKYILKVLKKEGEIKDEILGIMCRCVHVWMRGCVDV